MLHKHDNIHAQLRTLYVQQDSELTQTKIILHADFIKKAATLWQQLHSHTSREFEGRNVKHRQLLFLPMKKIRLVTGIGYKLPLEDEDAEDLLQQLNDVVTFPNFLELLQQGWFQRYKRGVPPRSRAAKHVPPAKTTWFLILQGDRQTTMLVMFKTHKDSQKIEFKDSKGRATASPLFHLVNSDLSQKFQGVVSIHAKPESEHGEQWESTLLDGWTLHVIRKKVKVIRRMKHRGPSKKGGAKKKIKVGDGQSDKIISQDKNNEKIEKQVKVGDGQSDKVISQDKNTEKIEKQVKVGDGQSEKVISSQDKKTEKISCAWGGVDWVCGTRYRLYYTLSNERNAKKHTKRNQGDQLDFTCGSRSILVRLTEPGKQKKARN